MLKKIVLILILCFILLGCDNTDDVPLSWSKKNGVDILITVKGEPVNGTVTYQEIDFYNNTLLNKAEITLKKGEPIGEWRLFTNNGMELLKGKGEWERVNTNYVFNGEIEILNHPAFKNKVILKGKFLLNLKYLVTGLGDYLESYGKNLNSRELLGRDGLGVIELKDGTEIKKIDGTIIRFENNHISSISYEKGEELYLKISDKPDKNGLYDIKFKMNYTDYMNYRSYPNRIVEVNTKGTVKLGNGIADMLLELKPNTKFITYEDEEFYDENVQYQVESKYDESGLYSYELNENKNKYSINFTRDSLKNIPISNFSWEKQYKYLLLTEEEKKEKIKSRIEREMRMEEERREANEKEREILIERIKKREEEERRQMKEMMKGRVEELNKKSEYDMKSLMLF